MEINYDRYETTISCDDNSCSLRYKLDGDTLGVFRYRYNEVVGKKFTQKVLVLREADHEKLFKEIMFDMGFSPELGEKVLTNIRERNHMLVYEHITKNPQTILGV
jgi:hypothetical protein